MLKKPYDEMVEKISGENMFDLSEKPNKNASSPSHEELLKKVADLEKRLADTQNFENVLKQIIEEIGEKSGVIFLQALVTEISKKLGFKFVLVGKLILPANDKVETLALCCAGKIVDNITYNLAGTPCENVVGKKVCFYPDKIQEMFPNDHELVDLGVKSYLGIPLIGSSGKATGILVAMHDQPIKDISMLQSIMMSFTFRALAEIERLETMKLLAESKTRYKSLVEGSLDIIYIFSSKKGIVYCSSRIKEILGYTPEYMIKNSFVWHDSIHPDDLKAVDSSIEEFNKGRDFKIEYRIKDKFGAWHWFFGRFIGKKMEGDEIIIEGMATDITERKIAEEKLHDLNEKFSSVFFKSPIAKTLTRLDGKWEMVNEPLCNIFGYTEEELLNMKFQDITHPDDLKNNLSYAHDLIQGKIKSFSIEKRYIRKTGEIIWCLLSVSLIRDKNDNPSYFIGEIQDISEIKKSEKALRDSQKLFKDFMDNTSMVTYVKDKDLRLVFVNKELEKALNIKAEDLIGKKNEDYLPPDIADQITKNDLLIMNKKIPVEFEETVYTYNIPRTYIARKFPIFDEKGEAYLLGGSSIDITARKKVEMELLTAKEEAVQANNFKEKFISLIAHDLRSPSNTISKLLKILYKDIEGLLPEDKRNIMAIISDSSDKLYQRIENILDINRVKTGISKPELRYVSPVSIAARAISVFEPEANRKGVVLLNKVTMKEDIFTDGSLLGSVIGNLLSNAIKFSKAKDVVTLFMKEEKPPYIFAVSDNGIGISELTIKTIFESSKKISKLGTAGEVGMGFGLSISLEIMKTLGGTISVESVEGKGTTFYITLPKAKLKILLVDDDPLFRFEQSLYLKELDVDIIEATDGKDGMEKLKTQSTSLVITDLNMSGMDGYLLLKKIKDDKETKHIPVIATSGYLDKEYKDRAMKMGAADFLQKPIKAQELIALVKKILWQD